MNCAKNVHQVTDCVRLEMALAKRATHSWPLSRLPAQLPAQQPAATPAAAPSAMPGLLSNALLQSSVETRIWQVDGGAHVVSVRNYTGGAVLVKLSTLDGQAVVFQRSFDLMTGDRTWVELSAEAERDVDAAITRQRGFDPDLWVIEVEDRYGRHLLDEDGLSS